MFKQWRLDNLEYDKARRKLWYHLNHDADYAKNKDKIIARTRAWAKANPAKVAEIRRNRRAREQSAEGTHTAADVVELWEAQDHLCAVRIVPIRSPILPVTVPLPCRSHCCACQWRFQLAVESSILCRWHNISKQDEDDIEWAQRELGTLFVK